MSRAAQNIFVEERVEEDYFVAGIEWAEKRGMRIASVSLGYKDWSVRNDAARHFNVKPAEQFFALILVNLHECLDDVD